jgi:hypothetical protein
MKPTKTRTATTLSAALVTAALLAGCQSASGGGKPPRTEPSSSGVPHGYVEGAEETAEQQSRLVMADTRTGEVHVLDLVTEEVSSAGRAEGVRSITVLDENRREVTRSEQCPGVHGEATAEDEAVVIGCENGVLIYRDGAITKVDSPTEYGRIGNQAGSEGSPVVLGDYKKDADAELERPEKGKVTRTIPVMDQWREPLEWQQPRPAIFVRDHTAYVSDPSARKLHAIDVESGEQLASATLPKAPNELSGVRH